MEAEYCWRFLGEKDTKIIFVMLVFRSIADERERKRERECEVKITVKRVE